MSDERPEQRVPPQLHADGPAGTLAPLLRSRTLFVAVVILGVALRLFTLALAGDHLMTAWSGGGDQQDYITLASNILAGDGFTYHHQATAFRPPLFPLLLAGFMWLFGVHWIIAVRVFQFVAGLLTAVICARLSARLFDPPAARVALVAALFMPMSIYFQNEILTECATSLFVALSLLYLARSISENRTSDYVLLGFFSSLAALIRFNAAALVMVACGVTLVCGGARKRMRRFVIVTGACLVTLAPWLIRTGVAFHGHAIYSTYSGFAAVEGVVMPLGRTQPGETDATESALHWGNWSVETNGPARLLLPAEPELNREAWSVAGRLWKEQGWRMAPLTLKKISAFWLGTDQVFWTQSFSWRNRLLRWAGVGFYWLILVLAIRGWFRLLRRNPTIAQVLLFYAIFVTVLHIPLVMNTRLRSPLLDPLLVALAGGAWLSKRRESPATP